VSPDLVATAAKNTISCWKLIEDYEELRNCGIAGIAELRELRDCVIA